MSAPTKSFFRRYWFYMLSGTYGFVSAMAGYSLLTAPFWIGCIAMGAAYIGAHLLDHAA